MEWYYAVNGTQHGPVDEQTLSRLAREGRLQPDDLVWNQSMGDQWVAASTLPDLLDFGTEQGPSPTSPFEATLGHTANADLMAQARHCLAGRWGESIGIYVLYMAIVIGLSFIPRIGSIALWIIAGPLMLGITIFFLSIVRRREAHITTLFDGFKRFGTSLAAYLLMSILVFLWSLLFIIPGLIAAYAYAQTFFVIADDPSVGPLEAITRSKVMMRGLKWKRFCLDCRFIGWSILCMLTCGLGFLWVFPYMDASHARFYDDMQGAATAVAESDETAVTSD